MNEYRRPQTPDHPPALLAPPQTPLHAVVDLNMATGFAQDAPAVQTAIMAATQGPIRASEFYDKTSAAAWRSKPSWYLVAREDCLIQPDRQRAFPKKFQRRHRKSRPVLCHNSRVQRMWPMSLHKSQAAAPTVVDSAVQPLNPKSTKNRA